MFAPRFLRPVQPLLAVCLAAAPVACRSRSSEPARPRNLLLIVVDTLRRDHLHAYGYARETAPTISRLAAQGARCDGVSPTSWTKPAVASILTGLHPLRHQTIGFRDVMPAAIVTLAERLRGRGYRTLGVTANGFVARKFGFAQGFEVYEAMGEHGHGHFAPAEALNEELFPRLSGLRAPFFLFVHYIDPHAPYDPVKGWDDGPLPERLAARGGVRIQDLHMESFVERPRQLVADAIDLYDAEIRRSDDGIKALLRRLERLGLMDGTLTIVTSDHGEEFEEHGRMGHGQTLYEEQLLVPLVVHGPSVAAGRRLGAVSLLDIAPSALELLGVPFEAGSFDAMSVAGSLRGEPGGGRVRSFLFHLDVEAGQRLGLVRGGHKLILGRGPYEKELFDLTRDPRERVNLLEAAETPRAFEPLALTLAEQHNALVRVAHVAKRASDDAELKERLAALGYLGSAETDARAIPARIAVADPRVGGPLGWEDSGRLLACATPTEPATAAQLLAGWLGVDGSGRWTEATATVLLKAGPRARSVRVRGRAERPPARLKLSVEGRTLIDARVAGAFDLRAPAGELASRMALLRIEVAPGFVPAPSPSPPAPADRAPSPAPPDRRPRGVVVDSVCLEAQGR